MARRKIQRRRAVTSRRKAPRWVGYAILAGFLIFAFAVFSVVTSKNVPNDSSLSSDAIQAPTVPIDLQSSPTPFPTNEPTVLFDDQTRVIVKGMLAQYFGQYRATSASDAQKIEDYKIENIGG